MNVSVIDPRLLKRAMLMLDMSLFIDAVNFIDPEPNANSALRAEVTVA